MSSLRKKIYDQLYSHNLRKGRNVSITESAIFLLIILNVVAIIVESFPDIESRYRHFFYLFEVVSVVIFSVEYLIRIWLAPLRYPELAAGAARWKFITSTYGLIDLFAILPFYLPYLVTLDGRLLRILRLLRIVRVFKLNRYSRSMQLVGDVFREVKNDLIVTLMVCLMLLLVASSIMFYLEHDAQPTRFTTILDSFWWAVATLTTVGYGDIYPITGWGKLISGFIAILGIGLVALPAAILSSAFILKLNERKSENNKKDLYCPHCGKRIDEGDTHKLSPK